MATTTAATTASKTRAGRCWKPAQRASARFCVTVDREARDYLPHMYGPASYTVLERVRASSPSRSPTSTAA